jgi:hypothetical protein
MEQKTVFQVLPQDGTITIRTGDAPKIFPPENIEIAGTITAPRIFYEARKGHITPDFTPGNTHVIVIRKNKSITLTYNDTSHFRHIINGRLAYSEEYRKLAINELTSYSPMELAKLLKRNRRLFADQAEGMRVISDLMNFQGSVKADIEKQEDGRGNKRNRVAVSVESNIPIEFSLKIPMFVGEPAQFFNVEIALEAQGQSVVCFLESPRFLDLTEMESERILEQELEVFRAAGLAVIDL